MKIKIKGNRFLKILTQTLNRYFYDGVGRAAAQLSYYMFFSIFPMLMLANIVIGKFDMDIKSVLMSFGEILPEGVINIVADYLDYLGRVDSSSVFWVSLFMTLYALTRAFNSLLTSTRAAYRVERAGKVNYLTAAVISALMLLAFFVMAIMTFAGGIVLEKLLLYITIPPSIMSLFKLLQYVLVPSILFFMLTWFYYIVPSRKYPVKLAMPGAAFAMVAFNIVTMVFSYYASNFARYSLLYGSLAAVMVLMIWLNMLGVILIMGGELNHVLINNRKI